MNDVKEKQGELNFEEANDKELAEKLEDKPMNTDMQRVASTVMLQAALLYRDMHVPIDIAELKQLPQRTADQMRTKGHSKITPKGAAKLHNEHISFAEKAMTGFSDRIRREVAAACSKMDKAGQEWVILHAEYLSKCTKQLIPAFDKDEVYTLLQMYNAGQLEYMFKPYREEKAKRMGDEIAAIADEAAAAQTNTTTDETTTASSEQ